MNVLDKLLEIDPKKITVETMELKIKSLSEKTGKDIVFKVRGLTGAEYEEVQGMAVDYGSKGEVTGINTGDIQIFTCLFGIVEPNLKNETLLNNFGAHTPKELLNKLLKPGEIALVSEKIQHLSGFGEDSVEEVKNV